MIVESLCMGCMNGLAGQTVCPKCGWTATQPVDTPLQLAPRTVLVDQYVVGKVLGHGGFGIVYLGWDLNLELKVAIKEYLPGDYATRAPDGTTVAPYSGTAHETFDYGLTKFLEEGRAIARFNDHPGIVPVLNFFRSHGTGYLVMSYIPGRTLKEHLAARGGRLPWTETFGISMQVMDTLRAVHEGGLLHRDISPDNIYLSDSKQVKLLDFGAARMALGDKSKSLSVILKAGYAPKEQYQTKGHQGPWTDVYALGATMYRALTGEIPPESLDRNEHDDLAPPRTRESDIPEAAEAALLRALAVNPSARFQTVAEFQSALLDTRTQSTPPGPIVRDDEYRPTVLRQGNIPAPPPSPIPAPVPAPLPGPVPRPRVQLPDAFDRAVAGAMPYAARVVGMTGVFGLKPAASEEAAAAGPAAIAAGIVGLIGAWSAFSSVTISTALPGVLGPVAAILGICSTAANLLLLLGAYLTGQNDPRGPQLAWASAWVVGALAAGGYFVYLFNYSSVAGFAFAWQIARAQFNNLFVSILLLGIVLFFLGRRRR